MCKFFLYTWAAIANGKSTDATKAKQKIQYEFGATEKMVTIK
jgi:hypothetical protein